MYIKRVHLVQFCGFLDFTVELDKGCTVLIGPNNGGKTTILRAISLAFEGLSHGSNQLRHYRELRAQLLSQYQDHQTSRANAKTAGVPPAELKRIDQQWQHQRTSVLQHTVPLRSGADELAHLFGYSDSSSFTFGHDKTTGFTVEVTIELEGNEIVLTAKEIRPAPGHSKQIETDILLAGESLFTSLDDTTSALLEKVIALNANLISPYIFIMPSENALAWPDIQQHIKNGQDYQIWRNRLHWLAEGKDPDRYKKVIERIRAYLGETRLNVPGRTKDSHPKVTLTYEENGVTLDVNEGGAGFRTLLVLAANVELSETNVLLFDEPDSHLHSSVQRQVAEFLVNAASHRQIIVTTHAPDMIEEFPLETLLWVDRTKPAAAPADSVSQALVQLGVASHRQAFQVLNAKALLYFEDKPDERALSKLMERCNKQALLSMCRTARLNGAAEAKHLPTIARFIQAHHNKTIPMAALLDADYAVDLAPSVEGLVFISKLPCKELENLLLLQPHAILKRVQKIAEAGDSPIDLDLGALEKLIDAESVSPTATDQVKFNWIANRCPADRQPDPGELKKITQEFEERWQDPAFRRRFCHGKQVLKAVKRRIQEGYSISFSDDSAFNFYEPDESIRTLFDAVETHIMGLLDGLQQ